MNEEPEKSILEKRQDERVVVELEVSFERLSEEEMRTDIQSEIYKEVFTSDHIDKGTAEEVSAHKAFTQNVSISGLKLTGDLRLIGGQPLSEGMPLRVSIMLPEAPQAIHTLARVVWTASVGEGKFTAGLFFEAINKKDVNKVSRFILLQKKAQMGR